MSLNTTTTSSAIAVSDVYITLTSTTGVQVPALPVGPTTYIIVEAELMEVTSFSGTSGDPVGVSRGQMGTKAVAHNTGAPAFIFLSTDNYQNIAGNLAVTNPINPYVGAPLTGATITPTATGNGSLTHFTGTTALVTINVPTGTLCTEITLVFDGSGSGLTWTAAGNISVAGTATTAKSSVTFRYDVSTSKWIPSRLA